MAAIDVSAWIPETQGSVVLDRVQQVSAAESLFRREPMTTNARSVPRVGSMEIETVEKSHDYGEDDSTSDDVTLASRKFGKLIRISDEDLKDSESVALDIVTAKKTSWAIAYAKFIDNATIGTTAATNGTTVPFTSIYRAIRTTNAVTGYTQDGNYLSTGGDLTYGDLSDVFGLIEDSDFYDETRTAVIASGAFKALVRGINDVNGDPIFRELSAWPNGGTGPTLFGHPVRWSIGAKTSATATSCPTGNPLMVVGNLDYAILGRRSGPESMTATADSGAAFASDEALLKIRARRGFAVGFEQAFAVLESTGSGS